jgi:hypothetical protein
VTVLSSSLVRCRSWGENLLLVAVETGYRLDEVLDKPFEDKTAQRILQGARYDVEVLDSNRPPDYRKPYVTKPELKIRVKQAVAELEQLGYQADSTN